jgi:hypothetical protein
MFKTFAAALFIFLTPLAVAAKTGSVCISPIPYAGSMAHGAAQSAIPYDFTVSFNGGKPLPISHTEPRLVTKLSLTSRHRVKIRQNGRPTESFTFSFSEHKTNRLCLTLSSRYMTWRLNLPGRKPWCRCGR